MKKLKLDYYKVILLCSILPLLIGLIISSLVFIKTSEYEIEKATFNHMISLAETAVENLEWYKMDDGDNFLKEENLIEEGEGRGIRDLETSYLYMVDAKTGNMLWHPSKDKIGKPVENDAVKQILTDIKNNKKLEPDVIEYKYNGEEKYAGYCIGENNDYIVVVTADSDEVMTGMKEVTIYNFIINFIVIVLSIISIIFLTRKIINPLKQIAENLKLISEGNLSTNIQNTSKIYENKLLLEAINTLQTELHIIISDSQRISDQLKEASSSVEELSSHTSENANQVSIVVEELANSSVSMAEDVQEISGQLIDVDHNIADIASSTEHLVSIANMLQSTNNEASNYIDNIAQSSVESVNAVQEISKQVNDTNSAVLQVQEAVKMIQSVAEQTNLLALNASIEAARVGEAGKGFAVVASEIGDLSVQSNESANRISDIVQNIIDQSKRSVSLSSDVEKVIIEEQQQINSAQQKFNDLNKQIDDSFDEINSIHTKVMSLDEDKTNIINSITDLSAISEENSASTEEASASVEEISNDVNNIHTNSIEIAQFAKNLNDTISYFKF